MFFFSRQSKRVFSCGWPELPTSLSNLVLGTCFIFHHVGREECFRGLSTLHRADSLCAGLHVILSRAAAFSGSSRDLRLSRVSTRAAQRQSSAFELTAMPPRAKKSKMWQQVGSRPTEEWMQAQAERLDRAFSSWVNPETKPDEDVTRALYGAQQDDLLESSQPPSSSSTMPGLDPQRSHRQAALMWSRMGGTGMLASAFDPARHSIIVAGRPVQARCLCCGSVMHPCFSCLSFNTEAPRQFFEVHMQVSNIAWAICF